jgi:hypothetical protein
VSEEGFRARRASDPPSGVVPFAGSPIEARTVELTTAVALLTSRVRLEVPALPLARVRRCVDAALVLAHAVELLVEALGAEELAADERALLAANHPFAWVRDVDFERPATVDAPDHREPGEEP